MSDSDAGNDEPATYRQAASEIEAILGAIEGDRNLDVDALADQVERASTLIKFCYAKLETAEVRVRKVTEDLKASRSDEEEPS